jgi:hypothetical protein
VKARLFEHTYSHTLNIDVLDDSTVDRMSVDIVNDSDSNLGVRVIFYDFTQGKIPATNKQSMIFALDAMKAAACPENCITLMEEFVSKMA